MARPPTPRHFSALAKSVWREVLEQWELDPTGLLLLRGGLEQFDVYTTARKELAQAASVTVTSDTGVVRQHPAAKVALDALSSRLADESDPFVLEEIGRPLAETGLLSRSPPRPP